MTCQHSLPTLVTWSRGATDTRRPVGRGRRLLLLFGLTALVAPAVQAMEFAIEAGQSWSGKSALGSTHTGFVRIGSDRSFLLLRGRVQVQPIATAGIVAGRDEGSHRRDVWLTGAGLRITRSGHGMKYWFWESIVVASSQDTPSLSGHLQFANGLGYAHGAWEAKVRHISNARLHEPNHGETMLLVGYRL